MKFFKKKIKQFYKKEEMEILKVKNLISYDVDRFESSEICSIVMEFKNIQDREFIFAYYYNKKLKGVAFNLAFEIREKMAPKDYRKIDFDKDFLEDLVGILMEDKKFRMEKLFLDQ
jgi:hypothetical protein